MKKITTLLDSITMYRVVLYGLTILAISGLVLSFFGTFPFTFLPMIGSLATLLLVSIATHYLFSIIYKAPANVESSFITAFILFLIIAPPTDVRGYIGVGLLAFVAIVSKYLIAYHNKHILNPAAAGLVIIGMLGFINATWWVGSVRMLPLVFIVGLLVVKKIRRFPLFLTYLLVGVCTVIVVASMNGSSIVDMLSQYAFSWPTVFFASIMLTEPFTTPPTRKLQIIYAAIVACLSSIPWHVGSIYNTPELALIIGNIFSYAVSAKGRFKLFFKEQIKIAEDTYEFVFEKVEGVTYLAGQYMEWTLPHKADLRGIRRYFTIASSPEDSDVRIGIKMTPAGMQGSSFKATLLKLTQGNYIHAVNPAGDFLLPDNKEEKLVFIAGGIGITPFISMLRSLLHKGEHRDITLFYSNKTINDIAYKEVLDRANKELGLKIVHVLSNKDMLPVDWQGEVGFITKEMIEEYVPDYTLNLFYLSGPQAMVDTYKIMLHDADVARSHIKTDYFPGFA